MRAFLEHLFNMQPATAKVKIRDTAVQNAEVYVEVPETRELKIEGHEGPCLWVLLVWFKSGGDTQWQNQGDP